VLSNARSDTYFGGYAADAKAGPGLYVFASGATYLGSYRDGKREGRGVMVVPDGGMYEGDWVADRFEGQVRRACAPCVCVSSGPVLCCGGE